MTYMQFHFLFIFPPILVLLALAPGIRGRIGTRGLWPVAAVPLIAFLYTTPWDNYLVYRGVWWYGLDRVIGTVGYVPIEEYMFFLLQPVLTGLWTMHLLARRGDVAGGAPPPRFVPRVPGLRLEPRPVRVWRARILTSLPWWALTAVGVVCLTTIPGLYMGLILAWASPVVALMWLFRGEELWRHIHVFGLAIGVPTVYLWVADAIAIHQGIWLISPEYTFGINPFGLPVEEATFFLITNVLSAVGVLLFAIPGIPEHQPSTRRTP
jgi:lycopene beta-cyclase